MENKFSVALGFAAGFLVGYHWPKIYQGVRTATQKVAGTVVNVAETTMRCAAEVKERIEDSREEAKYQESAKKDSTTSAPAV